MKRAVLSLLLLGASCGLMVVVGEAQSTNNFGYTQTNLVSDGSVPAAHTNANLSNPWGIAFLPGGPFWIGDNNTGVSTVYDATGNLVAPSTVTIPAPAGDSAPSTPTGVVINTTNGFLVSGAPSQFIFATEDGTISGWNGFLTNAVLAVNNPNFGSGSDPVFKGLALVTNSSGSFLLAANFRSGQIDVFDHNFSPSALAGTLTDPNLPAGYAPFGIHVLNNQVYVAYAQQDAPKHDPVAGAGNGFVDVFDLNGNLVQRLISNGSLNAPWGVVFAPASFGTFSNDLLVGNFGDGKINAFDGSGNLLGTVNDANGNPIVNLSLWELVFGSGGTGSPTTLYMTTGLANEMHGIFATITANNAPPAPQADFSISVTPASATVTRGGSANFQVQVSPVNGFTGNVVLACSGLPGETTCTFSPGTISNGAYASPSTLTISTAMPTGIYALAGPAGTGNRGAGLPLALGLAGVLIGVLLLARRSGEGALRRRLGYAVLCVAIAAAASAAGCSSNSTTTNSQMGTPAGAAVITVTGTSGSITHSTTAKLTVQ